jgi:hypothetical protein
VENNMGFAKREMEDRQAAYDEGLALCIEAGEIAGPQSEVTDAVKAAYDDNSGVDSCMQCDKNYERD